MATITVNNSAELKAAMATATGGDLILLNNTGAPYTLSTGADFSSTVTIRSADVNNKVVFSKISLSGATNITVDNVEVFSGTDFQSRKSHQVYDLDIQGSKNITISNSYIHSIAKGTLGADTDTVTGNHTIWIRKSDGVTLEGNKISNAYHAIQMLQNSNVTIKDNEITQTQGDGMRGGEWKNVLIEGNYIHNLLGTTQNINHSDMIQLWSSNASTVTENVTIRGNILDSGNGAGTQSIFMRNEAVDTKVKDSSFYYKNIVIEDNIIRNGHLNAVTVGETNGLIIRNNTLVSNPETPMPGTTSILHPQINIKSASTGVVIENNITKGISGTSADDVVQNNIIVNYHDPNNPNYVDKIFINAKSGGAGSVESYQILPGSQAAGHGASGSQFDTTPEKLTAVYTSEQFKGHENTIVFDASLTANASGPVSGGAQFLWDFGDGTTGAGKIVQHTFANSGNHFVTLTVQIGTQADTYVANNKTSDVVLIDIDFDNKTVVNESPNLSIKPSGFDDAFTKGSNNAANSAYMLSADTGFSLGRSGLLFGQTEFSISIDVQRSSINGGGGAILSLHTANSLIIDDSGTIRYTLTDANNVTKYLTSSVKISDLTWHNVVISYDTYNNEFKILLDGVVVSSNTAGGKTKPSESWDLVLGGYAWTKSVFTGNIDNLKINADPYGVQPLQPQNNNGNGNNPPGENVPGGNNGSAPNIDLHGTARADKICGSKVNATTVYAEVGNDIVRDFKEIHGGAGNDKLYASLKSASVLYGDAGNDVLYGYSGSNALHGGEGKDRMRGGTGEDTLYIDAADKYLNGGRGFDTAIYNAAGEYNIGKGASIASIEEFDFSNGKANKVHIDARDILQADDDMLFIVADSSDEIILHGKFSSIGNVTKDGELFYDYLISGKTVSGHVLVSEQADVTIMA